MVALIDGEMCMSNAGQYDDSDRDTMLVHVVIEANKQQQRELSK